MGGRASLDGGSAREKYLTAALDLLNEHGSADPSLGITIKGAATAAGLNRNTLYGHWETVTDLNHDVARYAVAEMDSWERRLTEVPVDVPLEEAIRAALDDEAFGMVLAVRSAATAFPPESLARREIAEWELRALERLGWWLEGRLRAEGRRWVDGADAQVAAVAVSACIQGAFVVVAFEHGFVVADWPEGTIDSIVATAASVVDELGEPGDAAREPSVAEAPVLPRCDLGTAKADIADRVLCAVLRAPFGQPASLVPGRLVDMARLARRVDVGERQLYRIWPSNEDFNADVLRRFRTRTDLYATKVFEIGLGERYATFEHLFASALQALIRSFVSDQRWTPFVSTLAVVNPHVRSRIPADLMDYGGVRTILVAVLAMARWYRRPEITADRFTEVMVRGMFGTQRLVAMNPDLLGETTVFRGARQPMLGMGLYFIGTSMATTVPPHLHPSLANTTAPPLAE